MHVIRRVRQFAVVFSLVAAAIISVASLGSSDDICEQACQAWEYCVPDNNPVVKCKVVGWPYDACYSKCKEEGDWTQEYADCVSAENECCEMEFCG